MYPALFWPIRGSLSQSKSNLLMQRLGELNLGQVKKIKLGLGNSAPGGDATGERRGS